MTFNQKQSDNNLCLKDRDFLICPGGSCDPHAVRHGAAAGVFSPMTVIKNEIEFQKECHNLNTITSTTYTIHDSYDSFIKKDNTICNI